MSTHTTSEEAPTTPRPQEYPAALAERLEQVHAIVSGLEPRFDELQGELAETKGLVGNLAKATSDDLRALKSKLGMLDAEIGGTIAVQREHGQAIESIRPKVERAVEDGGAARKTLDSIAETDADARAQERINRSKTELMRMHVSVNRYRAVVAFLAFALVAMPLVLSLLKGC